MQKIKKLLFFLTSEDRKYAAFLMIMILIGAILDMIGVASILPFIAVLTDPEIIDKNLILNFFFQKSKLFGIESNQEFTFVLGIIVFLLLLISLFFKAITLFVQVNFIQLREYTIGKRILEGYLHQPYAWFLNNHSADLGKTILSEVSAIIGYGIRPLIELFAKCMIAIALITLLILSDPRLALLIGFTLGGAYGIIFYLIRSYLEKLGKQRLKNNELRFVSINNAFGAIKEIKVGGIEKTFIKIFSDSAKIFSRTQASSQILSQLPRFFLEAIAFGGILLIILFLMMQKGDFTNALPIISLYVFAGYRLMPALQQIFSSLTLLAFVGPSLDKIYDDFKNLKKTSVKNYEQTIELKKYINLKNVYFNYPNSSKSALKDININIPAISSVGLIGATGSGKTTVVDVILGLLEPQKGTLEVDKTIITSNNLRSWQSSIGYVPQNIYLSDDTIAANIAFGVDPKNIDQQAVEKASKIANLHEFITDELPNKYETKIGERGIRLSGGQRQRIGIARALYHNPKVLILDEATSALDLQTEEVVMQAIKKLEKDITIILIAHRLDTVKNCQIIYKFEKGKIVDKGTFDELNLNTKNFKSISK